MITLSMIETLIRENQTKINTDIALFQSIIEANEGSLEPEKLYLYETAKEKLAESLRRQSEPMQFILRDTLSSLDHDRKTSNIENEIKEMENYAGHTVDEIEDLITLKRFQFTQDQDIALIEFLVDQFTKRNVFFGFIEK